MSRFYIRNKHSGPNHNFLSPRVPKNAIKRARSFATKEEAQRVANAVEWPWREVVEVSWVLAFFGANGKKPTHGTYLRGPGNGCCSSRDNARRYDSAEAARAALHPSCFSFADGPKDLSGWRVMRVTRVIRP